MGIGKRIEAAMKAAGLKPVDIANHLKITDSAVSQWFAKDTGPKASRLPELAKYIGVTVDQLTTDGAVGERLPVQVIHRVDVPAGRPDIPVWASAEAGKDGAIILVPDPVDYTTRSEGLRSVRDAYAFLVRGDSMSPAIEASDTVVINPRLLPRPGNDCVFIQPLQDGQHLALVKRLVRQTADGWVVRQFSPRRDFTLSKGQWPKAQVVVEIKRGNL